jgi:hypothetical protein
MKVSLRDTAQQEIGRELPAVNFSNGLDFGEAV